MMIFYKLFFLFFMSLNLFAAQNYIDSLTLTKVKKLVQKEEEIAIAYKKYILEKGSEPSSLATLKTTISSSSNGTYLPSNFSTNNYFGGIIDFSTNVNKLRSFSNSNSTSTANNDLKSNIYDYYYSNKYRTNTKAPASTNKNDIEIVLSTKEKFIYTNKSKITTTKIDAVAATAGKYYLDTNGVLHWYQSGNYKFSADKDLIVDSSVEIFKKDASGNIMKEPTTGKPIPAENFKTMIQDATYAGQTILKNNTNTDSADVYIGIDGANIVRQNPDILLDTRLGVIQISQKSGGMIVNGDIYTWGNNENRITGIDIDDYTKGSDSSSGDESVVLTTLIRAKVKMYDDDTTDGKNLTDFYAQNYFSSPLRPRFVDLFASVEHGTCGISTKGELYCGGLTANNIDSINTLVDNNTVTNPVEMLYRSTYFDGKTNSRKALKILANNRLWLILSIEGDIYRWGYEDINKNGFSGNETSTYNEVICEKVCKKWKKNGKCRKYFKEPTCTDNTKLDPVKITENITTTKFKDISNTLAIGYRKIFALSTTDELYLWGKDTNIADMTNTSCSVTWEEVAFNLCQATRITKHNSNLPDNLTFVSIRSGLKAIIALGSNGKYYKIEQPNTKKVQITEIKDKDGTITLLGTTALSVDLTSTGVVVYVDSENKLKSTYFSTSTFDATFITTINNISWKSIKVLDTNNSMCGINTDNQMYCWGIQTSSDSTTQENNTFMLPVFNTNLYDTTKDYLVAEGGTSTAPTTMTSGPTWLNGSKFYIKYPTYIGGFNYEFIFK